MHRKQYSNLDTSQATWGVNDRDGSLRRALSNTLVHAQDKLVFYCTEIRKSDVANSFAVS